jgi:predicted phosphodiesterase
MKKNPIFDAKILVISDIHLGNDNSNVNRLKYILSNITAEKIIIVGDLFDSVYFHRLKKEHWKILSLLRKKSKHSDIILTIGNHDYYDSESLYALLGFEVCNQHVEIINGKKFVFIHGHIFDFLITNFKTLSEYISNIYYYLCKFKWCRNIINKSLHSDSSKNDNIFYKHCVDFCKKYKYDVLICGHTHVCKEHKVDDITVLNSGCFMGEKCNYILINDNGEFIVN